MCDPGISNETFPHNHHDGPPGGNDIEQIPQRWRCNSYDSLSDSTIENYDHCNEVTDDDDEFYCSENTISCYKSSPAENNGDVNSSAHDSEDEESCSSISSGSAKSTSTSVSRKSIVFTNHILNRCNERGISTRKVFEIIESDDYKYDLGDGKREYQKDGICCITVSNDGGEDVGITAYEIHCKECGGAATLCEKGYCYSCCWGCRECSKYKCSGCNTVIPLGKGGVVTMLCKNFYVWNAAVDAHNAVARSAKSARNEVSMCAKGHVAPNVENRD